jgi:hypothetical protein
MPYQIRYREGVEDYINSLPENIRQVVFQHVDIIANNPGIGDAVKFYKPKRVYGIRCSMPSTTEWPAGIRIHYIWNNELEVVGIFNIGDHTRCVDGPFSIYPDER